MECCECKKRFEIKDGLPNLNFPEILEESDFRQQIMYDNRARLYDLRVRLSMLRLGVWEYVFMQDHLRQPLINSLELKKNALVLETSTGTGSALPSIAKQIGKGGQLHASDISSGMLKVAQRKMKVKGIRADLVQANASYLPYRTATFDAVFHIGGLNTFVDRKRAIEEMYRVAKPGCKIVISDEGLAPGKEKTLMGRLILKRDKQGIYSMRPPTEFVPDNTEGLKVYWIWHDVAWVVEFKKK